MADIGCVVEWSWYLGKSDELTRMSGLIVNSKLMKTDREKVRVFDVLLADGAFVIASGWKVIADIFLCFVFVCVNL